MNAAKDATELVAKLRAYHHSSQTKADKQHLAGYVLVLLLAVDVVSLQYSVGCHCYHCPCLFLLFPFYFFTL